MATATATRYTFKKLNKTGGTATTSAADLDKESRVTIIESIKIADREAPRELPKNCTKKGIDMMLIALLEVRPDLKGAKNSAGSLSDMLQQLSLVQSPQKDDARDSAKAFIRRVLASTNSMPSKVIAYVFQWMFGAELIDHVHFEMVDLLQDEGKIVSAKTMRSIATQTDFTKWPRMIELLAKIDQLFGEIKAEPIVEKQTCSGTKLNGKKCTKSPMKGTDYCNSHKE